ncbi:MAG TPA: mechanosensitive ion channel family protein [Alphaproteobacteria bacterium]
MKDTFLSIDWHQMSLVTVAFWESLGSRATSTIAVLLAGILLRWLIGVWLEKDTSLPHPVVVQWRQRLRYVLLIIVGIALLIIWAPQLRTFAVSIVAVAAALVIAFKELITCLTGAVIRAGVEGAKIGGRITIKEIHGDVVGNNILSTTLLEVNDFGQRTGRTVIVPNSMFLTESAYTETVDEHRYVLTMISVPLHKDDDWLGVQEKLMQIGTLLSEPYMREAKKRFAQFNRKFGFNAPGPEPKVLIDWIDPDKITLNLRMAVPVTEQNSMRQEVFRAILHKGEKTA